MRIWMVVCVIGLAGAGVYGEQPATRTIWASGAARAPRNYEGVRARLMAERGAQVVAARNLAVRLAEERGEATPGDSGSGYRGSDYRPFSGSIRGHRYTPAVHHPDGTAEVTAEVRQPTLEWIRPGGYTASLTSVPMRRTLSRFYSSTVYPNGAATVTTLRRTTVTRQVTQVP